MGLRCQRLTGGLTSLNTQARLEQAALRITPPAALAAGNEQSGKMAPTTNVQTV